MLSVTLAQWTTLQCHQYRRRKSCSTSVDDSSAVDISSPPTESSDPDVVVLSSGVNSQQNEPMSYLQLRSDIESSRQYLERCSGLVQEEDWPQVDTFYLYSIYDYIYSMSKIDSDSVFNSK